MNFDPGRFESAEFAPRTETINVESLREFFEPEEGAGRDCTWTVRGLNSVELNRAFEAEKKNRDVSKIIEGITNSGQLAKQVREVMGLGDTTPAEVAKRLEMLVAGSVKPEITLPVAVKLSENFPIEFLQLTNAITTLTGLGATVVKPEAVSRETQA